MSLIRPATPQDARRLVELLSPTRPRPLTLEEFTRQESEWPAPQYRQRWVLEQHATLVGTAQLFWWPFIAKDALQGSVVVSPDHRTQGHGCRLLAHLEEVAHSRRTTRLLGNILDQDDTSRNWAERHGYREDMHRFASELPLGSFDWDAFAPQLAQVQARGVTFQTMQHADAEEWARFDDFAADLLSQTPDLQGLPRWTSEQVRLEFQTRPVSRPDWIWIARNESGTWLGLTALAQFPDLVYNSFTGVIAPARGQGLARALKLLAIQAARQEGVTRMRTNNLSINAPMLAVNHALGFEQLPGHWVMTRDLPAPPPLT
ncbi:GNAT family N-acetyltransferase [Deinococcus peraridilitoris]|uniref:GNAT family N-acetyltransferase n=1 Tax=Deinococcus peraridilitoris TaxID=432329 RepID=UPI000302FCC5|nr:GNAT family N-acetyltransferase [Deinococcus peraridilitoris]